jgi:hypothetical protein
MALIAFLCPAVSQAGMSHLDPRYGKNGLALTPPATAGFEPDVELTVEGRAAVVANGIEGSAVTLLADGSRDMKFGQDGWFTFGKGSPLGDADELEFFPQSITVDHHGRILVFGTSIEPSRQAQGPEGSPISPNYAAVVRFGADDQLDLKFGEGKGYAIGNFGIAPERLTGFSRVSTLAGQVDSANRPVFVVGAAERLPGCYAHGTTAPSPRAVARLTPAGLPDLTFGGGDGIASIFGTGESTAFGLGGRDRPVVGVGRTGSYAANCGEGSVVYRFRVDGKPMRSFGPHGTRTFETMHLAIVEKSGAMVLSVRRGRTLEVAAIGANGFRDRDFGRDGLARVLLPARGVRLRPVAVDGRGRIVLAGYRRSPGYFLVARLLRSGRLERLSGKSSWIRARLPRHLEVSDSAASLDVSGRLLVAGFVSSRREPNGRFAVARFLLGR